MMMVMIVMAGVWVPVWVSMFINDDADACNRLLAMLVIVTMMRKISLRVDGRDGDALMLLGKTKATMTHDRECSDPKR